ncbi:MAG: hypothetical protein ACRERV_04645 [Methylococcales bacterium]
MLIYNQHSADPVSGYSFIQVAFRHLISFGGMCKKCRFSELDRKSFFDGVLLINLIQTFARGR